MLSKTIFPVSNAFDTFSTYRTRHLKSKDGMFNLRARYIKNNIITDTINV